MQIGFEARPDSISGLEQGDGHSYSGTYFRAHFFEGWEVDPGRQWIK